MEEKLTPAAHVGPVGIIRDRCKGCSFCIEFCPKTALEASPEFNAKGYHPPRLKDPAACAGCRLCQLICPELAIYIEGKPDAKQSSKQA